MGYDDNKYISRAIQIAFDAESRGNLPVGAVITLDNNIIAEGASSILTPVYHPGRHAEMEALRHVPIELWLRAREMSCYSTLEPCVMCFGALLLHGIGRIVFGAEDRQGGASSLLSHLPEYYGGGRGVPQWIGPIAAADCDDLYKRTIAKFDQLPVVGRLDDRLLTRD
ncbi:MAG TPA: deaminase [Blastocatellia bacterium]|nr:deaminase [Blastocatellia bacterium]